MIALDILDLLSRGRKGFARKERLGVLGRRKRGYRRLGVDGGLEVDISGERNKVGCAGRMELVLRLGRGIGGVINRRREAFGGVSRGRGAGLAVLGGGERRGR